MCGTPGDGGDDVFIHHQQHYDTRDTGPYDTDYDDRKGKYRASQDAGTFVRQSVVAKDTVSGVVKVAKEIDEFGVRCRR